MKRSEALMEIRWCGFHNNNEKAAIIAAQKGIGVAAYRKAFIDGQKMKKRGEPCGCASCTGKEKGK